MADPVKMRDFFRDDADDWFSSYMSNTSFFVVVAFSLEVPLTYGVSQGSIFGPLEHTSWKRNFLPFYADDTRFMVVKHYL